MLVLAGAISLVITSEPAAALLVLAIGAVMWLAGHWHYAMRHHEYASPLAQRVFQQVLPERLDPTRGWAVPVHIDESGADRRRFKHSRSQR